MSEANKEGYDTRETLLHHYTNCSRLQPGDRVAVRINNPYRRDTGILVEFVDIPAKCTDGHVFKHSFPCTAPRWWVQFKNPEEEILVYESDMKFVNWFGRFINWIQYL